MNWRSGGSCHVLSIPISRTDHEHLQRPVTRRFWPPPAYLYESNTYFVQFLMLGACFTQGGNGAFIIVLKIPLATAAMG
jgi:hypothetical protein